MKTLLFFTIFILTLSSCVKNNPDPSWLEVNEWTLLQNTNSQYPTGELTHNFTDAWVLVDDKIIGVFEVPFKIPILRSGKVNIKIIPAIRNNGIAATKKIYPFVERYEINTELVQNQTLVLNPTTQYVNVTKFWLEDFEDASLKIQDDPNSAASIMKGNVSDILRWGNYYGLINLSPTDSTWVGYTDDMNLPKGEEVYLEIDYYNTKSLVTGVLAISPSGVFNNTHVMLNAQDPSDVKWKKMYIDLKEIISNSASEAYFKQSFEAQIGYDLTDGFIIFDNIKVVHF
jgi:hypothetical protein